MKKEAVVDNLVHMRESLKYNFDRIELCSALDLGGLTPDYSFVDSAVRFHENVHVLIRPRQGNFIYSDLEKENIIQNINVFAKLGVKGFVVGCLDKNNQIDFPFSKNLSELCKLHGLDVTFNRAVDFSNNYKESLDALEFLGFNRVLTAGCKTVFIEGVDNLKGIVDYTSTMNIDVIAAGAISLEDIKIIISEEINVESVHFQVRKRINDSPFFGVEYMFDSDKAADISTLII